MKGQSSSTAAPEPEYDRTKFVSYEAQKRYIDNSVKRGMIQERGLNITIVNVSKQVKDRKWEELVKHPEAAVVPVVREFYANVEEHRNYRAFVRGRWVPFDRTTINRHYNLPNIDNDEYERMLQDEVNWETIMNALCPGTVNRWVLTQSGHLKSFPGKNLARSSKAWHYFVCSKFMPTTNHSAVSKDRAGLTYAIQIGKSIDVGMIIQRSILKALKTPKVGLPHPHLVFDLCKAAGVQWVEGEELLHPKGEMDNKIFGVYKTTAGDVEAGPSVPAKPRTVTQRLTDLEEQVKYMAEYQHRTVRYQGDLAAALMGAISQCASRLQITEPLPVLPGFDAPPPPVRPPADEEENEEEEEDEEGQEEEGPAEADQDEGMDGGDE